LPNGKFYVQVEMRLARFEHLMDRRPLLLNSVLLRQNPHNVHEWHKRAQLYQTQEQKQKVCDFVAYSKNCLHINSSEGI
jgi:hypothetical protein